MWLPLLLLSQSTASPQQPRILIDLLPKPCTHPSEQAGEIVVCGRREEPTVSVQYPPLRLPSRRRRLELVRMRRCLR